MTDESAPASAPPLRGTMIRGTLWMVGMRWVIRLLGLVSTAVLARLLTPADFGIVAMCMLVVGLLEVLCELNVGAVLVQRADATEEHWNSAWTLRIVQGLVVAALILAARPIAQAYFGDARLGSVLPLLAASVVIQSFENIGVVAFQRELNFRKEFQFKIARKIVTIAATIAVAVALRNYWALVFGIILGNSLGTVLSYFVHPYRPRFSFSAIREIWGVSRWFILIHISYYLLGKTDELVVGGKAGSRTLGTYTVSSELAELPTSEILFPMMRALFPGFAKLQNDRERLVASYLNVLGVTAVFALSVGLGVSLLAPYLVPILLGPKWIDAVPLLRILAIGGALRMIYHNTGSLLLAVGRAKTAALTATMQAILVIPVLWVAIAHGGIVFMIYVKVAMSCVFLVIWFSRVRLYLAIPTRAISSRLYRPMLAGAAMYGVVMATQPYLPHNPGLALVLTIAMGGAVFPGVLFGLWRLAGSPDSAEKFFLEVLTSRVLDPLQRRFRRR